MIEWDVNAVRTLLGPMREAYSQGANAMARARQELGQERNHILATLIAYDLQAGSYTREALEMQKERADWCDQVADLLRPFASGPSSVLEVGCGEATTLRGVAERLNNPQVRMLGFDISWSRLLFARRWLEGCTLESSLFAADLFNIPLPDSSVDVIYTSHSLEPNGGREAEALAELARVARRAIVLVEPIFEMADEAAQRRMTTNRYVRGLKAQADEIGTVTKYELLPYSPEVLNPSGVIVVELDKRSSGEDGRWQCPVTGHSLQSYGDSFFAKDAGLAYPVLREIPLLLPHYAIIASHFEDAGGLGNSNECAA